MIVYKKESCNNFGSTDEGIRKLERRNVGSFILGQSKMSEVKKLRIPTAKNETIWLCTLQHINRITHAAGNQSLKSGSSDFNSGTQTTRSRWLRFLINTNMNSLIFYLRSESFILNRRRLPTSSETKKSILILFPKTTWFMQGL